MNIHINALGEVIDIKTDKLIEYNNVPLKLKGYVDDVHRMQQLVGDDDQFRVYLYKGRPYLCIEFLKAELDVQFWALVKKLARALGMKMVEMDGPNEGCRHVELTYRLPFGLPDNELIDTRDAIRNTFQKVWKEGGLSVI